ncbi:MAG: hypothetical protein MJZ86_05710 [Bacteroidales bacterium]|nr:hypothetical protein [Bacteroidales bacterium]
MQIYEFFPKHQYIIKKNVSENVKILFLAGVLQAIFTMFPALKKPCFSTALRLFSRVGLQRDYTGLSVKKGSHLTGDKTKEKNMWKWLSSPALSYLNL